jgi:hypothetical protein
VLKSVQIAENYSNASTRTHIVASGACVSVCVSYSDESLT